MAVRQGESTENVRESDAAERDSAQERLFSNLNEDEGQDQNQDGADNQDQDQEGQGADGQDGEGTEGDQGQDDKQDGQETEDGQDGKDGQDQGEDGKPKEGEDANDEMVPKSKFEKTVAKMQQRIDQLTAQVRGVKTETAAAPADPERARLEKMSAQELRDLKREVRIAQAREKDDGKLDKLVDLEMKIDEVVQSAPQRFEQQQAAMYNQVAEEISADEEIQDIEKAAPVIKQLAVEIYRRYPKLQQAVEGQAMALQLAAEQYKARAKGGTVQTGQERNTELRRKVNKLKMRTSLDASRSRGQQQSTDVVKLREQAFRGADDKTRINLIKNDPAFNIDEIIPAEYKGS